jgi:hypothetical protein
LAPRVDIASLDAMTRRQRHDIVQYLRHAAAADPRNQVLIIVVADRKVVANDLEELLEYLEVA